MAGLIKSFRVNLNEKRRVCQALKYDGHVERPLGNKLVSCIGKARMESVHSITGHIEFLIFVVRDSTWLKMYLLGNIELFN